MKIKTYLLLTLAFCSGLNAQKSDTGTWMMLFGNEKLKNNFNYHYEVQNRDYGFVGDLNQLLLRTGVGYNLSENNNNVLLGYAYVLTNVYDENDNIKKTDEHRIYQQFITKQKFGRLAINHRYRIEERFLEQNTELRFRYHLSLIVPFNSLNLTKKTWYASAYNELFINAKKEPFDRNRLYGALGYVVNDNIRIEAGFMNQATKSITRNQFQLGIYLNDVFASKKLN